MNKKVDNMVAVFILFLLCFSITGNVAGQAQVQVGVSDGDTFTWSVSGDFHNPSSGSYTLNELYNTQQIKMKVIAVPGDILSQSSNGTTHYPPGAVKCTFTQLFRNGSEISWDEDVGLGQGWDLVITSANLNVNDRLSLEDSLSPIISETLTRIYATGAREINHITKSDTDNNLDLYFDRKTGVTVEINFNTSIQGTLAMRLTDSNVWAVSESSIASSSPSPSPSLTPSPSVPEFPSTILIIASIITASLIGAILIKRKQPVSSVELA